VDRLRAVIAERDRSASWRQQANRLAYRQGPVPPGPAAGEQTKAPEQKQERENENKNENEKPLRRVDPMIIEWRRQAERKRKLDEERAEERKNRPIPVILQSGDLRHRAPHLYKKPNVVPWGIGMLIAGLSTLTLTMA